jgi:DNA repair exonuclease SbcCD nuclease subunit
MKLLHASDLHLGSPLRAASAREPAVGEALAQAMRGLLSRIVDVALAEAVDVVLLAGDVFDNAVPDVTLRTRFAADLARLRRANVPVVLIRGNHDTMLDLDRYGPPGAGIELLHRDRASLRVGGATIHGLGHRGGMSRSLLPDYPAPEPGRLNVGLMHCSLDGAPGHDPYAPCGTGDLLGHGFDYWALGHIHKRSETVQDGAAVVMAGIPQGRHANETGGGSVTVATLGGTPSLRAVPVAGVRFARLELMLWDGPDAFAQAAPEPDGHHHVLRLTVGGTDLPEADLLEMARTVLEDRDDVHIEAVTRRDAPAARMRGDAIAALLAEETASPAFRDGAAADLAALRAELPAEIRDALAPETLDALLAEGLALARRALART